MRVSNKIEEIRDFRAENDLTWGLVPTMGFLHEGHLSLIRQARQECGMVAVSIFVNPAQFNDKSDLDSYPRDLERDLKLLSHEKVDLVWTPVPEQVYPEDFKTYVKVEKLTEVLEGAKRPGHFRGVTTVVAKLFNVFQPDFAYFGQKDAQQVTVIRQMVRDLNFNLEIVVCPTVREPDGLAMSSRNARLSSTARSHATSLYRALKYAESRIDDGEKNAGMIKIEIEKIIKKNTLAKVDYISIADLYTLKELDEVTGPALVSLAVYMEDVRLIDNLIVNK